jgi:hypothetical protein
MDEETDYAAQREARYAERQRKEQRARFALAVYRDLCAEMNHRHIPEGKNTDYPGLATEAVEAADALLTALEHDPAAKILPDYIP